MPRQSAEDRYRQILSQQRSGETLAALAARCGVNYQTLSWWKWQIRVRDRGEGARAAPTARGGQAAALLPVKLTGQPQLGPLLPFMRAQQPQLEVVLRQSGHLVRVPQGFEPSVLARVVETLEACGE